MYIVRGEDSFYLDLETANEGELGVRCNERADQLLPEVVENLRPVLTSCARKSSLLALNN